MRTLGYILKSNNLITQLRRAEMELKKGQNMMEHEAEIFSRPARTWFQTATKKQESECK
jgi:ATP-dependent RNA helicase DDX27